MQGCTVRHTTNQTSAGVIRIMLAPSKLETSDALYIFAHANGVKEV
jgi:hypothetical protein